MLKKKRIAKLFALVLTFAMLFLMAIPTNAESQYCRVYAVDDNDDAEVQVMASLQSHIYGEVYFERAYATLRWDFRDGVVSSSTYDYMALEITLKVWKSVTLVDMFNTQEDSIAEGDYIYAGSESRIYEPQDEVDYLYATYFAYCSSAEREFDIPALRIHASDYLNIE